MSKFESRFIEVEAAHTPNVVVHHLAIPAYICSLKMGLGINEGIHALMNLDNKYRLGGLVHADGVFENGMPTLIGRFHDTKLVANTGQLLMREYLNVTDEDILKIAAGHLSTEILQIANTPRNIEIIWSAIKNLPPIYMKLIFGTV